MANDLHWLQTSYKYPLGGVNSPYGLYARSFKMSCVEIYIVGESYDLEDNPIAVASQPCVYIHVLPGKHRAASSGKRI